MSGKAERNFGLAHAKFREFLELDDGDEVARTALILAFAYCFESAWKWLRQRLRDSGEDPKGPRDTLALCFANGLIEPGMEEDWLEMVTDRNLAVHTYNEELAVELTQRIRTRYAARFESLAGNASP